MSPNDLAIAERITDTGAVYVIGARPGGKVKLGWSRDLTQRLRQLQTGNPERLRILAFTPGSQVVERALHREFADLREGGEWFRDDDREITETIAGVLDWERKGRPAP